MRQCILQMVVELQPAPCYNHRNFLTAQNHLHCLTWDMHELCHHKVWAITMQKNCSCFKPNPASINSALLPFTWCSIVRSRRKTHKIMLPHWDLFFLGRPCWMKRWTESMGHSSEKALLSNEVGLSCRTVLVFGTNE